MSDQIKHECGIALLRLLKPLDFYYQKYGTPFYGLNKLYLLMQKQHNRGQDGAGLANIKLDVEPGGRYISRKRATGSGAITEIFQDIFQKFKNLEAKDPTILKDVKRLKASAGFTGELFLGHLRYGTFGQNSIESCHPFLRQNNWMTRNLIVAGNFNLTNVDELFDLLVELGQHPKEMSDTVTVMEKIGHFLDVENEILFKQFKQQGFNNQQISSKIAESLDIQRILTNSAETWDGGYAMAGLFGHGDAFVLRDPNGIRPVYYYHDDEVAVVCSERPVIQTAFNVKLDTIKELTPGHAIIIKKNGHISEALVRKPLEKTPCSFERIYFSRGSDADIYGERIQLGKNVAERALAATEYDLKNTVFSYIPNTAETAFYGLLKGVEHHFNKEKLKHLRALPEKASDEQILEVLGDRLRVEKIAIKDVKLRTFITADNSRNEMVTHVYDVTYGKIREGIDSIVIIDDSIVRGTTLRQSIIKMLDRLGPKKIIVVSSAPQIRYPDCYGIDMAIINDFVAFQAMVALLKENNKLDLLDKVYEKAKLEMQKPKEQMKNVVKELYEQFTETQISNKIAQLVTPENNKAKVEIIFQSVEGLHNACPNNHGDWYFTGNYPTPGGNKVVNKAYMNFMEGKKTRAY
jgi:amidophosphoribosyltransferase